LRGEDVGHQERIKHRGSNFEHRIPNAHDPTLNER
jgi:hypothetical protein